MISHTTDSKNEIQPTAEERLDALARDVAALQDSARHLQKLLREQGELITEYITKQMVSAGAGDGDNGQIRPEDALYTFVCKQRFEKLHKDIERLRQSIQSSAGSAAPRQTQVA